MNITIRTQGFDTTGAIDGFVRQQADAALEKFSEHIVSVDVFMKDINGPKGGIDKQVLARIRLPGRQLIAMEVTRADLYAAVTVCLRRAKRAVRRAVKKLQRVADRQ